MTNIVSLNETPDPFCELFLLKMHNGVSCSDSCIDIQSSVTQDYCQPLFYCSWMHHTLQFNKNSRETAQSWFVENICCTFFVSKFLSHSIIHCRVLAILFVTSLMYMFQHLFLCGVCFLHNFHTTAVTLDNG
jgi:hypothetical protein